MMLLILFCTATLMSCAAFYQCSNFWAVWKVKSQNGGDASQNRTHPELCDVEGHILRNIDTQNLALMLI